MLIEFSVGNFRSFKDIVTLSMVAAKLTAKDKALDENNVFEAPGAPALLTSAAIYGANASGKSNLIAAIDFMKEFVLNSPKETRPTGSISVEPFRLSVDDAERSSHFEVVFLLDGQRYRYGFEATTQRVTSEWLFTVPSTKEARLFERDGGQVKLGTGFQEGKALIDRTRPNALFLSVAAQFNGPVSQRLLGWFRDLGVASGLEDMGLRFFTQRRFLDGEQRNEIIDFVRNLDLGIDDVRVEERRAERMAFPDDMPEAVQEAFETILSATEAEYAQVAVHTIHRVPDSASADAREIVFNLDEHESEGTKKLFALAGPVTLALKAGEVLVIDELDARLHPVMTREIVSLFNSRETNPNHAQLIFTTQDTNLLDNSLFRRDQIWFTEKDRFGASHLYSLAEFNVRNDEAFERNYVKGKYGAVPFLGNLRRVLEAT